MTNQSNQTSKKHSITNYSIILTKLNERLKEDKLALFFGKFFILFFVFIVLLLWQINSGIFDGFYQWVYSKSVKYIPRDTVTIVVGVLVSIGVWFYYKHKIYTIRYKPNLIFTFIVLFAGLIYFPERWNQKWEFFPKWIGYAVIADIYLLLLMGEIWSWVNFLRIVHPEVSITDKSFGLDNPLANDDEFGRKDFAKEIGKYVLSSFGDCSLAIGISGTWGAGKSYLLYQIQESIESKKDNSIIQIRFNPWRSSNHNRIVEDFLQTLKSELGKYDTSLSSKLDKYLKVLVETDKSNWVKTIFDLFDIRKERPSEELYTSINEALGLLNKRLVIYIDDLDRLHKEEILEVFRIIRNTADFRNTCFIVAYDRDYIQSSFHTVNTQMGNYLDKIFQTEFVLPTIDQNILIGVIIDELFSRCDKNPELDSAIKQLFSNKDSRNLILSHILHRRDAIRFSNMFSFDVNAVRDEVDYSDFFLVMLLKMKYPSVYNILQFRDNRHTILDAKKEENKTVYHFLQNGFDDLTSKNRQVFDALTSNSRESIKNLLAVLFKESGQIPVNSIRFVENYYRYFNLSISPSDLKRGEFFKVLRYLFDDARPIIDKWFKEKNRGNLEIIFFNYSLSDFDDFEQIKNYIYGMKKVASINLKEDSVTQFHVALNNSGFNREGFAGLFKPDNLSGLDDLIGETLFPEGIMDPFNGKIIEQLFVEGEDGNNLYTKEKSKSLFINRFNQMMNTELSFDLLISSWKNLIAGKDFKESDDDILNSTHNFIYYLQRNKENCFREIGVLFDRDKGFESENQNLAVKRGEKYVKQYDIIGDVINLLTYEYGPTINFGTEEQKNEKKDRIKFFRDLSIQFNIPSRRMTDLLHGLWILFGLRNDKTKYLENIYNYYPVKLNDFLEYDNKVFEVIDRLKDMNSDSSKL